VKQNQEDPHFNEEQVWEILERVKDPEIPVVSVVEMGIVREFRIDGRNIWVKITPTFAGCPALFTIQDEVRSSLTDAGFTQVHLQISHNPPWSSDWITPEARQKLTDFGLAPPPIHNGIIPIQIMENVNCPYCKSSHTTMKNAFGPTLCRAIYYCQNCQQPFEQFKPL
jgi:ring-1,2-phenylacetyl-CoA epoxidase subunit PaaD